MSKAIIYTTFKRWTGTELFHFEHLTGKLLIVSLEGESRGIHKRIDDNATALFRQFNKDMANGVPHHLREFDPCTEGEFADAYCKVLKDMKIEAETFTHSLFTHSNF
jgi:hypothetical protein